MKNEIMLNYSVNVGGPKKRNAEGYHDRSGDEGKSAFNFKKG